MIFPLLPEDGYIHKFENGSEYCYDSKKNAWDKLSNNYYDKTPKVLDLISTKPEKIKELSLSCEELINSGFISNALGTEHKYQSERDDQNNLMGLVLSGDDNNLKCYDGSSWDYKLHTHNQLVQVLKDGKNVKLRILENFNNKKKLVEESTTLEEINLISF